MEKENKKKMVAEGLAGVAIAYLGGRQMCQGITKAWNNGGRQLMDITVKFFCKKFH